MQAFPGPSIAFRRGAVPLRLARPSPAWRRLRKSWPRLPPPPTRPRGAVGSPPDSNPSDARRTAIVVATEKAAPAVVSVTVRRSAVVAYGNPFFQDPFFDFFGPAVPPQGDEQPGLGRHRHQGRLSSSPTATWWAGPSQGGELEGITVTLSDGRQFPAKLVGRRQRQRSGRHQDPGRRTCPWPRSQDKPDNLIGEWVVAIGNPYGYLIGDTKPTVTVGVISALNRTFSSTSDIHYHNMIQTDASINPGNSGGALVNVDGKAHRHQHLHLHRRRQVPGLHRAGFRHPHPEGQAGDGRTDQVRAHPRVHHRHLRGPEHGPEPGPA